MFVDNILILPFPSVYLFIEIVKVQYYVTGVQHSESQFLKVVLHLWLL